MSVFSTQMIDNLTAKRNLEPSRCIRWTLYARTKLKPYLGIFYTVLHSSFLILSFVLVQKLPSISPGELSLVRNAAIFAFNLPIAVYCVKDVLGPRLKFKMLVIRSFLGATANYLNIVAFRYLPLTESTIIMSSTPAMVSVMARFYLKEPFGVVQLSAVILTTVGMLLSIDLPGFLQNGEFDHGPDYFMGLGCAVGSAVILSVIMVALRKITDIHFSVFLLYLGMWGMLESVILNVTFSEFTLPNCEGWDSWNIVLMGFFCVLASCFFKLALQVEEAGIFSVLTSSLDILLSMGFQVLFFDDIPDVYNVAGGLVVLVSVGLIGTRKWLMTQPEGSKNRRRLRCLLF